MRLAVWGPLVGFMLDEECHVYIHTYAYTDSVGPSFEPFCFHTIG